MHPTHGADDWLGQNWCDECIIDCSWCEGTGWTECSCDSEHAWCDAQRCPHCDGTGEEE